MLIFNLAINLADKIFSKEGFLGLIAFMSTVSVILLTLAILALV
jgi:hypothetical protein